MFCPQTIHISILIDPTLFVFGWFIFSSVPLSSQAMYFWTSKLSWRRFTRSTARTTTTPSLCSRATRRTRASSATCWRVWSGWGESPRAETEVWKVSLISFSSRFQLWLACWTLITCFARVRQNMCTYVRMETKEEWSLIQHPTCLGGLIFEYWIWMFHKGTVGPWQRCSLF